MEKLHIEKNTIQETLVIPLYSRKLCSELYPEIFKDEQASQLIEKLDYDFEAAAEKTKGLLLSYGTLEIAMRQSNLAYEVKEYLSNHPKAAVVNMGCGLDFTGENCDNGRCLIYNIDMPDVIEVRNQLTQERERVFNIGCDLNDLSWFEKIDSSGGAVFFAAGVFYYFKTEEMQRLINNMAKRFPEGKLVFDTGGKASLKIMLKTFVKQSGIKNVDAYFHVDSIEKDVLPWLENSKVTGRGYMTGYKDINELGISGFFKFLSKFGDRHLHLQIIRFDFEKQ